jgi:hypothetical protein
VAGVGPTKWQTLQEKLPYIEVEDAETAVALIRERIEYAKEQIDAIDLPGASAAPQNENNNTDLDDENNTTAE